MDLWKKKKRFAVLALGDKAPNVEWFASISETRSEHQITVCESNETEKEDQIPVSAPTGKLSSSTHITPSHSKDVIEQCELLLKDSFEGMRKFIDATSSKEALRALKKFKSRVSTIKTSAQLFSSLHTFGGGQSYSLKGSRIGVQPTARSRRQQGLPRGAAPLTQGRRPLSISRPRSDKRKKRKHNFALNVESNQANAKKH